MQSDEQAIRQLVLSWGKATENGDVEQVLSMIADDALFLMPGCEPMNKNGFAVAMTGLKQVKFNVRSDIQEVKLLGDWAYCRNKLTVQITPQGGAAGAAPIVRTGHVLSILRKQNGVWVLMRDANMLSLVES
jgi:uncharacterized protein (TIGR02246 family)